MLKAARNVAIIVLLALVVDLVPGGGSAATALLTAITLVFMALIVLGLYVFYRQNQLTWLGLTDRERGLFVAALGVIALMVAGADELLATGPGTIVWAVLLAAAGATIWRIWVEAKSL